MENKYKEKTSFSGYFFSAKRGLLFQYVFLGVQLIIILCLISDPGKTF